MRLKALILSFVLLSTVVATAPVASARDDPIIVCVTEPCGPQPPDLPTVQEVLDTIDRYIDIADEVCTKPTGCHDVPLPEYLCVKIYCWRLPG